MLKKMKNKYKRRDKMKKVKVREIVEFLNNYVVSQDEAKKQLAVLIKNKLRRENIKENDWKEEITPFNVLLIGPTGTGKTHLFKSLAKYLDVAFCKVDISSYTKSGYVGNNVDEIISVHLYHAAKEKAKSKLKEKLKERYMNAVLARIAKEYINQYLAKKTKFGDGLLFSITLMKNIMKKVDKGDPEILEKELTITIEYTDQDFKGNRGISEFKVKKTIRDKIKNLVDILIEEEIDQNLEYEFEQEIKKYIENGIVFIDEIDKIASGKNDDRIDTSGVQKELLTLIEGKTVITKVGPVRTDHILFIGAGAFHTSKPSDLLPELQGRFPVKIVLKKLTKKDYKDILIKPKYSLIKRICKLYEVDGLKLIFTQDAIDKIAEICEKYNTTDEYLGARRLFTLLSIITEDIDLELEDKNINEFVIDADYVEKKVKEKEKYINEALDYIRNKRSIGFLG